MKYLALLLLAPLMALAQTRYEAEAGTVGGGANVQSEPAASGARIVGGMGSVGARVAVNVAGGTGGQATVVIRFGNNTAGGSRLSWYLNGTRVAQLTFPQTGGWAVFADMVLTSITLLPGANLIAVQHDASDSGAVDFDYFEVTVTAPTKPPISRLLDGDGFLRACGPVAPPGALPTPYTPRLPAQLKGPCTSITVEANTKGGAVAWWCPRIAPETADLHLYAVTWAAVTLPMLVDFARLGLPGDNADLIRSMQSKYATLHVADMCDVWAPMRDRLNASRPAPLPVPAGDWKATGSTIFNYANGRLTSSTGRLATKGAPCDGITVVTAGAATYQGLVGGSPTEKTACTK